ncbi:hypothetical protein [Nostoc sp.]
METSVTNPGILSLVATQPLLFKEVELMETSNLHRRKVGLMP